MPNLFRYERPQRGRLREHWQLNCDLFGVASVEADMEILLLAYELMRAYGARDEDFEIRLNNREVVPETLSLLAKMHGLSITKAQHTALVRLMDRREKMKPLEYAGKLRELLGEKLAQVVLTQYTPAMIRKLIQETKSGKSFFDLLEMLDKRGIKNVQHDPGLMRGFDYYTGMIFEVFDTSPENNRALFGGGRYDSLFDLFGADPMPAVGFGMGDVSIRNFLETRDLLPPYIASTDIYLAVPDPAGMLFAQGVAQRLRRRGLTIAVDITGRKLPDQIKSAAKKSVPFLLVAGSEEEKSGMFRLKNLTTKEETEIPEQLIPDAVYEALD